MGRNLSAEEVEQEHLRVLGPRLGPIYHALDNEVTWLHAKWLEYRKLYAEEKRVELLNETAPFFFRVVQDALWEDVLLHISRLTEPPEQGPKTKRHQNLTLLRLPLAVSDEALRAELTSLVDSACRAAEFAHEWRNKQLAHLDLPTVQDGASQLPPISREMIEKALASIRQVMNPISLHYLQSEVGYEYFLSTQDADTLAYYLGAGLKHDGERRRRLAEGRPLPSDFEPVGG